MLSNFVTFEIVQANLRRGCPGRYYLLISMSLTIRRMGGELLNHTLDVLHEIALDPKTHPRDAIKIMRKADGILNKTFGQVFEMHTHIQLFITCIHVHVHIHLYMHICTCAFE